jgi:hypothetical protein
MAPALPGVYSSSMKNKKHSFKPGKARFVLNTALLMALTGCIGYADAQGIRITVPAPVIVVTPPVIVASPVVVTQDNYVYYPSYGVYYNTSRHQYAYMDGNAWVSRPAPMGVSADIVLASPSVKMDFHDSPSHHHADMVRKYPRDFKGDRPDQRVQGRDEHRERDK